MKQTKNFYVADFETTAKENETKVYLWAVVRNGDYKTSYGKNIEGFFDFIDDFKSPQKIYFHNLKFDGSFILWYILHNIGGKWNEKPKRKYEFSTMINDTGVFYKIVYINKHNKRITFLDSLKIIPLPVSKISSFVGIEETKEKINHNLDRWNNYEPTEQEKHYCYIDCLIVCKALEKLKELNVNGMTISGSALTDFRNKINYFRFTEMYNKMTLEIDAQIRTSYKGGFCYLNPEYIEKDIKNGSVIDVNSLYPSVMHDCLLPYGEPLYFEGEPQKIRTLPLYIISINVSFRLKENHLPTIQLKHSIFFKSNEFINSSNGKIIQLTLTSVDFELFKEHYYIDFIEYNCGYYFHGENKNFREYIEFWTSQKIKGKEQGNICLYMTSKLMMNSLYGKFASSPFGQSKKPVIKDGVLYYENMEVEEHKLYYIPVASFITAYARFKTITTAQKIYEQKMNNGKSYYIYSDTDSIHFINGCDLSGIEIDDYKLGAWKIEETFLQGRYLRQKTYIHKNGKELKITACGMPESCYEYVTFENFHIGRSFKGKLIPRQVNGGVKLCDTEFTIR